MARRHAGKASSEDRAARDRGRRSKPKTVAPGRLAQGALAALERERDALRAALEREQARARKLEEVNAAARDRIAWALDSLQKFSNTKS